MSPSSFRFLFAVAALVLLAGCATIPGLSERRPQDPRLPGRHIVIDLSDQRAFLYDGNRQLASAPISSGREGKDTPTGTYKVIQKSPDHRSSLYGNYVRDGKIVKSNVDSRKDPRPAGSTFLGAPMPYFLRFTGAYGLHGAANVPDYPASNGCVRLAPRDARKFYDAVDLGTPVVVLR